MFPRAPDTAPSPGVFWLPPKEATPAPPKPAAPDVPQGFETRTWSLRDVLELALRNSPATRAAWADARAAAARYGAERAAYLPNLDLGAGAAAKSTYASDADTSTTQASYGPSLNLTWLLLDFGARSGALESARQALYAANWSQNRVLQDTVFSAEQAYYDHMAAKAVAQARKTSLADARVQLEAAEGRHAAGVATIADVLQARTAQAQARLAVDSTEGLIQITRGALAAAIGLPANFAFDIEELPGDVSVEPLVQRVDELIAQALAARPDLAAARAQVLADQAQVTRIRGQGLPQITGSANAGLTRFDVDRGGSTSGPNSRWENTVGAGVFLTVPLFTGFSQTYSLRRAQAEAQAAQERAQGAAQRVILQVFSRYYALQTATQKVRTTDELFASADQSEKVALGRYKEGVGTILDLVTAQSALADARAQRIQSRWEWYTALAQLAHDTGLLNLQGDSPLTPGPTSAPTQGTQER